MEVTRKNFNETLPAIEKSIKDADFLVIDTEFTGLINGKDVSMFDSPEEYYLRLLNGCSDFLLIQYGLCAFRWDPQTKHYMNEAYNFYLFPRGRPGPERMFLCQSSSLDFLASQGFDFNKVIRDGISYMTEPAETRLKEYITERQKLYTNEKELINIPEENKQQIEDICKKVRAFLDENKSEQMEIDRCNAFIRRLLFQELGNRFKSEAFVETKVLENKNRVLSVTRLKSDSDSKDRDSMKKKKEWEEFDEAVGFSKVARMISQSDKLVIGHNMVLDILHTLNHFFQPLPPDYTSFKEFAHCMFPRILDTKYMSSLPPFKDKMSSSVLSHLLATLMEPPFGMPTVGSEPNRGYNQTVDKQHEAGYDAYVTGLCFLSMHTHLTKLRNETCARVDSTAAILKPFLNKIFLAKTAHQDSPYINLVGKDPSPSRDHVFHLTFPKEWQRNDINQLFSPFGPITVQFLDETSALIALSRREQARDVTRALANQGRALLVPYSKFKPANKVQPQNDKFWRKPDEDQSTQKSSIQSRPPQPKPPPAKHIEKHARASTHVLQNRRTSAHVADEARTDVHVADKARTDVQAADKERTDVHVANAARTNVHVADKERTFAIGEERTGADLHVADKERTGVHIADKERTAVDIGDKVRMAVDVGVKLDRAEVAGLLKNGRQGTPSGSSSDAVASRKRTSSGVFQVDEAEPMVKKTSNSSPVTPTQSVGNGVRKCSETLGKPKERKLADIVIETFVDGSAKSTVAAFKENDSWE